MLEDPQVPFSDFILDLDAGPHTPLANPLVCGPATTTRASLHTAETPPPNPSWRSLIDFNGKGGACPSPLPFRLNQGASTAPTTGGAPTSYSWASRATKAQQYLSKLSTTLPPGLVGRIPSVTLCGEPQARKGNALDQQIGTAKWRVGTGPSPLALSGNAYLTGPYAGAPYGLSVVVPAEKVGPFDYGKIVTRASDRRRTAHVSNYRLQSAADDRRRRPAAPEDAQRRRRPLQLRLNPTNCGALDHRPRRSLRPMARPSPCPRRSRRPAAVRSRSTRSSRPPRTRKHRAPTA